MPRVHVLVSGLVQGVYYRASTVEVARGLGLTGWVRNLKDGRVEILAFGEDEPLAHLVEGCRVGPPQARVDNVEAWAAEGEKAHKGFTKRFTA